MPRGTDLQINKCLIDAEKWGFSDALTDIIIDFEDHAGYFR